MKTWVFLALVLASTSAEAIPMADEPANRVIFSKNRQFKACVSAWRNVTTVKSVRKGWFDKKLWTVPQYFDYETLSDDGQYIFGVHGIFKMPKTMKGTEVIRVYLSDGSLRVFNLDQFVRDKTKMEPAEIMGMMLYNWGRVIGMQGSLILIKTCEGRSMSANVWTGEVKVNRNESILPSGSSVISSSNVLR